jgi:PAS domain S-box-containing protein
MVGVLTCAADLHYFKRIFDAMNLPANVEVLITDNNCSLIYSYPEPDKARLFGESIDGFLVNELQTTDVPRVIEINGSNGEPRICAINRVFENENGRVSNYIVASISKAQVLKNANDALFYSFLIIFFIVFLSLAIAWIYGKTTIQNPISKLVNLTREFAEGNLDARADNTATPQELSLLTDSFHNMANRLSESQNALARETERLRVTLKSIGDGVVTTDTQGVVLLINAAAEKILERSAGEIVGRRLEDVYVTVDERSLKPRPDLVKEIIQTGQPSLGENHALLLTGNKNQKNIFENGAPIRNQIGEILGVVIVFRDITQELHMKQELNRIGKLETVGVLAGGIAHDFNNILAAILGNIELSILDNNLSPKSRGFLDGAINACLRARGLTQQLLTFARGGNPVLEVFSLGKIIRETAEFVIHGSKTVCKFDIPENLWLVEIDPGQISQVFQNLIINGIQAMPEGGAISISCRNLEGLNENIPGLANEARYVQVLVADDGPGIPAENVEKVFDPFFSTKEKGNGLGLAICHSIICKHGGHIAITKNSPEHGVEFRILLPVSENHYECEENQTGKDEGQSLREANRLKIMIMDDEEMVRITAKSILENSGHQVELAKDGSEAIGIYREKFDDNEPFDLLIMDLTVPGGMGGKEAIKEILNIHPEAKAVVASGYSEDPVMSDYRQYGFIAALAKPFGMKKLNDLIESLSFTVKD